MDSINVNGASKNAVEIDSKQGGNKAAPRGGANNGIVEHHMVDSINHGAQSVKVKSAMAEHGHTNVTYHNGGEM